ncbi:hypothetical protein FA15DRAFT_7972 [Coprinopsis marcescibilis]|uniref:Uncharacterized protein n=1 Tax=Coprinopsis marcescibilis TaxID=230819 RepID=A0A5C3LCF7_COPMA|nr:hypothetical protein FA15DRAFT_7972 [Coprinopsis marcescibilis]
MCNKTRAFGIMDITDATMLSDLGVEEVRRLHNRRRRNMPVKYPFKLVVSFLYNMQAGYHTVKDGHYERVVLLVHSLERNFEIMSIQAETYNNSRNFLERYQLFRVMKHISDEDNNRTPFHARTMEWWTTRYIDTFRKEDLHRRIIYNFDSKIQDGGNVSADGTIKRKRFLRHLARADIEGRFAAHAEWLLANQIASAASYIQLFDTSYWVKYCRNLVSARKEAAKRAAKGERKWGIPHGEPVGYRKDDEFGFERFGSNLSVWNKKLESALKRTEKPLDGEPSLISLPPRPDSKSRRQQKRQKTQKRQTDQYIYDSDFTEPSTSGESDSDEGEFKPSLEKLRSIPAFCLQSQGISPGCFKWNCPASQCGYYIDLLENTTLSKTSHAGERFFRKELCDIVSQHFRVAHLEPLELGIEIKNGKSYLTDLSGSDKGSNGVRRSSRAPKPKKRLQL